MFDVPPYLPSQFSLHFSLPKQTLADSGTSNIKVNQTQVSDQMGHPVECLIIVEVAMPHPVINQTLLVSLQVWSRCTIYSALISPLSAFLPPSLPNRPSRVDVATCQSRRFLFAAEKCIAKAAAAINFVTLINQFEAAAVFSTVPQNKNG